MKYIIECTYSHCRKQGKAVSEIMEKMYAIEDNLEFLADTYITQYPNYDFSVLSSLQHAEQICVDLNQAVDEFYVEEGRTSAFLEVVTRESAISNDMSFLCGDTEALKKYSLADGVYSYYTKLADTDYYFRFM